MSNQGEQIVQQQMRRLIISMVKIRPNPRKTSSDVRRSDEKTSIQNEQVERLDIEDYLQLLAHQKKHLNNSRWKKLNRINQSLQMEQESYKHFLTVASHSNYRRLEHPGYYNQLLQVKNQYPLSFFASIEKDISRTLSNTNPFQQQLRNVLSAYAIRNPTLLYCQGMNYIVAYLLINEMSQEQVFWFLACLVENILPDDYFKDLTTISIISYIFNDILGQLFPQFLLEMTEAGMDSSVFLVPWFVCLFSKGFINSVSTYLISVILLQSREYRIGFILLKIALALITIVLTVEKSFYNTKDFKTIKDTLQLSVYEISLPQIKEMFGLVELDYEIYLKLEDHYREEKKIARQEGLKARQGKKLPLPVCNKEYPICFHRIEMQKKIGSIEQSLTLKNGFDVRSQIIEDYLEQQVVHQNVDISYNSIQQCLIGRHNHICHLQQEEFHNRLEDKRKNYNRETVQVQVLNPLEEQSIQQDTHLETAEQRFAQLSGYFVVDQKYQMQENDEIYFDQTPKKKLDLSYFNAENMDFKEQNITKNSIKKPVQKEAEEENSVRAVVGNVFKKVLQKIQGLKQMRAKRLSQKFVIEQNS